MMRKVTWLSALFTAVVVVCASALVSNKAEAQSFSDVVEDVSQSIVGVALYSPLESPAPMLRGTGFIVGDGSWVVTNYHVVDKVLDPGVVEHFVALAGEGIKAKSIKLSLVGVDPAHDLALLKLEQSLPALTLDTDALLKPGSEIAFTGFPIGAVLGLYPATHRGWIAAVTPDAVPMASTQSLTAKSLAKLEAGSLIYQLDATAYPGNSGSPVYNIETGRVVGVINKVLVKEGKENALSAPSGISYAIPVKHVKALLKRHN